MHWACPRRLRIAMAVVAACGLCLAACGSSSHSSTAAASITPGLQFARCMRAHGASSFPDPDSRGRIALSPSEAQSPAFRSAQQACHGYLPKLGFGPTMSAGQRQQALAFAKCMRSNGEPGFPDPTLTASAGATRVLVLRGMVFALGPGINPKSPGFKQAATRCGVTPPSGSPS
jgi:hypothetical protein